MAAVHTTVSMFLICSAAYDSYQGAPRRFGAIVCVFEKKKRSVQLTTNDLHRFVLAAAVSNNEARGLFRAQSVVANAFCSCAAA